MKFYQCLPSWIANCLDGQVVREIRLRNNAVVRVNIDGDWYVCTFEGLTSHFDGANCLDVDCNTIVQTACNGSIYAYEQMLSCGYFTLDDGSRFGVAGSYAPAGQLFKEYTSICIRVPQMVNCANKQLMSVVGKGNTLIVGAPGNGKTTLLRDIAKELSVHHNVVVVDERGELAIAQVLSNCDVLKWISKPVGVEMALRCLSPNYILCDELSPDDISWIGRATTSGVKVISTFHAGTLDELKTNQNLMGTFQNVVMCGSVGHYHCYDISKLQVE